MVVMTGRGIDHPYFALPPTWLIAHRGGSLEGPENTLVAFERAEALGADVIETDVRLSRDGEVMVFHDADTRRITGAPGTIEERTRAELEQLDAAYGYTEDGHTFPWRGKGVRIPTLAAVLARFPRLRFNLEAKGKEERLAVALRDVLEAAHRERTVCVGAGNRAQARRLEALLPAYARYLPTLSAIPHFIAAWGLIPGRWASDEYDLAALPFRYFGLRVVSRRVVEHFRSRGMVVQIWTVDAESEMRDLLDKKVGGIMSDRPSLLKRVMGR